MVEEKVTVKTFLNCSLLAVAALFCANSAAQGALENPYNGSIEGGISVISGWHCDANLIEIIIDDRPAKVAAYGTVRGDTQGACNDTNNGFGLLWNFNLLGDGEHRLRAYADGVLFADVNFLVNTLGANYLTGLDRTVTVHDFPKLGDITGLAWEESKQNFVLSEVNLDTSSKSDNQLLTEKMLGEWIFNEIVLVASADFYVFVGVVEYSNEPGQWYAVGGDISGNVVVGGYDPTLQRFVMLDMSPENFDKLYIYDFSSPDLVIGEYYHIDGDEEDLDFYFHAMGGKFPQGLIADSLVKEARTTARFATEADVVSAVKKIKSDGSNLLYRHKSVEKQAAVKSIYEELRRELDDLR